MSLFYYAHKVTFTGSLSTVKRKVEQSQRAIGSDVPYSTRASDRLYGQSPTQPRTAACLDPWSKANQSVVFRKDFPQVLVSSHYPPIELISVPRYATDVLIATPYRR